jgi:hypothetical protein
MSKALDMIMNGKYQTNSDIIASCYRARLRTPGKPKRVRRRSNKTA